jgi:predicted Zn-dependent protease
MNRAFPITFLCWGFLVLAGCSVNPATGERSFTAFMSQAEELEVGRREHPKILKAHGGAYSDSHLGAYVRRVGLSLTRVSEIPDLRFSFVVVNDDKINAFALPGGYVYITRGLIALADDEAEMAAVLAHEIGHVTARHSAQRYSKAMATNIGLAVLGIVGSAAGVPSGAGNLASLGAQLYLQSYSREQELEADVLGIRYLTRAGYDARAMTRFFHKLEAHKRLEATLSGDPKAADRHHVLATHPRTAERIRQAATLARVTPAARPRVGRDDYLARIDGLIFGDDPSQGVRRGREFSHPELGIRFRVPPGFTLFNQPTAVVARGPKNAAIVFDMVQGEKASRVGGLAGYLVEDWGGRLNLVAVERLTINGLEAATGQASLSTSKGAADVRLIVIRAPPDRLYRFIFQTPVALTARLATELQRTTYSFRRLSSDETARVKPLRLRVITVKKGDTARSLAAAMPFETGQLEWFEVLNGLARNQPLTPGSRVKIVVD